MKKDLAGRAVLFIAPNFFGYEFEIANTLREMGAIVDYIPDRPFKSVMLKALTRIFRKRVVQFTTQYYNRKIAILSKRSYDYVFVVNGEGLSEEFLAGVREKYKSAVFLFYCWDSFSNRKNLELNLKYFDHGFTYDPNDAKRLGLKYRPLFFASHFKREKKKSCEYDLSFAGTAHSDRFRIVREVRSRLPRDLKFFWFLYLQAPWVYYFYRLFNRSFTTAKREDFSATLVAVVLIGRRNRHRDNR